MPTTIHGLQHIFSSVERGYRSTQARGFQTVAASEELFGSKDLEVLERAALYSISRERRQADDLPVKETFFRLPSGRFAIGRTVTWAPDSTGREGNYVTHHVILAEGDLLNGYANPFAVLDAAKLAKPDLDLTPRALPPLAISVSDEAPDFGGFKKLPADFLSSLAISAVDGGEKPVLLIGDEARARGVLQALFHALALQERLKLTYCTHFYESDHLRSLFSIATVKSRSEAPSQLQAYSVFDMENGEFPAIRPTSPYSEWLSLCVKEGHWKEVPDLNKILNSLREDQGDLANLPPPSVPMKAYAALWERAGEHMTRALIGKAPLITKILQPLPTRQPLADSLLASSSPSALCGPRAAADQTDACLMELRAKATRKAWVMWQKKWKKEPEIVAFIAKHKKPWWQRLRRAKA